MHTYSESHGHGMFPVGRVTDSEISEAAKFFEDLESKGEVFGKSTPHIEIRFEYVPKYQDKERKSLKASFFNSEGKGISMSVLIGE